MNLLEVLRVALAQVAHPNREGDGLRLEELQAIYGRITSLNQKMHRLQAEHQQALFQLRHLEARIKTLAQLHEDVVTAYWNKDKSMEQFVCLRPFERVSIFPNGDVYTCPIGSVKNNHSIGNLFTDTFDNIWNSDRAKQLRYAVSMGKFEYCNRFCKEIQAGVRGLPSSSLRFRIEQSYHFSSFENCTISELPKYVNLYIDESCNLTCPACRNQRKVTTGEEAKKILDILLEKILPNLGRCEQLTMLVTGEFLVSMPAIQFLQKISHKNFPNLTLRLMTNGQLFTDKNWGRLSNLHGVPVQLSISIDATNKEMYERIRRGANWDVLLKNLAYISLLKVSGQIVHLRFNYLVQRENYSAMREFVTLAKRFNADEVWFQRITDWGTMKREEFHSIDVFHPDHPQFEQASVLLRGILSDETEIRITESCLDDREQVIET